MGVFTKDHMNSYGSKDSPNWLTNRFHDSLIIRADPSNPWFHFSFRVDADWSQRSYGATKKRPSLAGDGRVV